MQHWIFVSGGGSSHGLKAVADETVDIGTASCNMKTTKIEANPNLVTYGVAKDGVAVTVHPSDPVTDLTMKQLQDCMWRTTVQRRIILNLVCSLNR